MAHSINWRLWLLALILLVGTFLRFYRIDKVPSGIIQDEAAIGYNAYSILQTGRDEYGQILPLAFRSFGDYKLPLYLYFTVPVIKLLGPTVVAERFTSAFSGSISILLVFLLARELFGRRRFLLAASCMAVFAIAPWSIFFSRGGHEANLGLFLLLLGLWVQLVGFRKNKPHLAFVSAALFALTTYCYIAFKAISLIVFTSTALLALNHKRRFFFALLTFAILAAPQYYLMLFAAGSNRINSLFDSQYVPPRYVSYFSPRSMFFDPDPDGNKSYPQLSAFYAWMVVPYLLGLFALAKAKNTPRKFIFLALLAAAPLPAAIARDPFSNIRALPFVAPVSIVIGLGLEKLLRFRILIFSLLLISIVALYRSNFVLLPNLRAADWVYGYEKMAKIIKEDYPNSKIVFNDPRGVYYIELLYFLGYPPATYQAENIAAPLPNYYNNIVFDPHHKFGNVESRPIDWGLDPVTNEIIITGPLGVSVAQEKDHFLDTAFTIYAPDGQLLYTGYQTQPQLVHGK